METAPGSPTRPEVSPRHLLYSLVGWALHAVFGFLALVSGLVAPPAGVAVIIVAWAATAIYSLANWRRAPWVALAMGVLAGVLWLGIVGFGGLVLGWTA